MSSSSSPPSFDGEKILVVNPAAGNASHVEQLRSLADEYGFSVRETESADDIVEQAEAAARDAGVVAVAGGDGTLTRAVRGFEDADAFDDTLFGVIPAGTGNDFAANVGITDIESAFEILATGDRRRIDLGVVNDTPFLNSCVAGLTAESSAATDPAQKERWGVMAYAMTTLRTATSFKGLHVDVHPEDEEPWEADVTVVLIGNGRRFPDGEHTQANVEDGLLDVTLVESAGTLQAVGESAAHALGVDTEHVRQFLTPHLSVDIRGAPDRVSIDGEITTTTELDVGVWPSRLWIAVGPGYETQPT